MKGLSWEAEKDESYNEAADTYATVAVIKVSNNPNF